MLQDGFDPAAVLSAVARERITHLFLLPPLLYRLADHYAATPTDISSLRALSYSGCPASSTRIAEAVSLLGPVLVQVYGQHEAGLISILTTADHEAGHPNRLRSVGRPLPGVDVEVRATDGRPVDVGSPGEIWVRTPTVMESYWKQPELTGQTLQEGWLHTGDLGFLDNDGYLTLMGRSKDMIVVVGGHVYPTELEHLINSHPRVTNSAVFAVPDRDGIEQVHAVVVRHTDADVGEQELRALIREVRGPMYVPAQISFADALPLTSAGKPDKTMLGQQPS